MRHPRNDPGGDVVRVADVQHLLIPLVVLYLVSFPELPRLVLEWLFVVVYVVGLLVLALAHGQFGS